MLASAISRENSSNNNSFHVDESTGFHIRGQCRQLRLMWTILWAYRSIYIYTAVDLSIRSELRDIVATKIKGLMSNCRSVRGQSQAAKLKCSSLARVSAQRTGSVQYRCWLG
jgi:hypothetical protein